MFQRLVNRLFGRTAEKTRSVDDMRKDMEWLFPPGDPHDAKAWDRYWIDQLEHGFGPGLFDMMIQDEKLVRAAQKFELRTVLCVGNGISEEAVALSAAGLEVTAMDLSPIAIKVCRAIAETYEASDRFYPEEFLRPGGNVEFVIGDLFDSRHCPGPYDIVIERRTIQDYPPERHAEAVRLLIARLVERGILVSHCHDNRWNPIREPGSQPFHATRAHILEAGLAIGNAADMDVLDGRTAIVFTSTG